MNPLLLSALVIAMIAVSLICCVRAMMETGFRRLLYAGVVVLIMAATLGSLALP